jgi:hypothetical protein
MVLDGIRSLKVFELDVVGSQQGHKILHDLVISRGIYKEEAVHFYSLCT